LNKQRLSPILQSSFDPDEKGTVLSVNHDFGEQQLRTLVILCYFCNDVYYLQNTFADLKRKLVKTKKIKIDYDFSFNDKWTGFAQTHNHEHDENGDADHIENGNHTELHQQKTVDSLLNKFKVKEEHALKFGRLIIQDAGGRMKPINTFSSELLRKVSHANEYKGMNSDQVFYQCLNMHSSD
jgi:hypothetical protein